MKYGLLDMQVDAATGAALLAAHYLDAGMHEADARVLHGVMCEPTPDYTAVARPGVASDHLNSGAL